MSSARFLQAITGVFVALIVALVIAVLVHVTGCSTPPALATTGPCPTAGAFRCNNTQLEFCSGGAWTPAMPDTCGRPGVVCCRSRAVAEAREVLNCVPADRCLP